MRSTHSAIARHARIANSQLLLRRIHLPSTSSTTGTVSARQPRKPGNGHINPRRPLDSEDKDAGTSKSASTTEDTEQEKGQVRQMTFTSIEELQRFLAEGGGKHPPTVPPPSGTDGEPSPPPEATDSTEKPKRRTRTPSKDKDGASPPPTLPPGLDVLWSPAIDSTPASSSVLPPEQILNDALTSLRIAMQPQTQHRAASPSSSSSGSGTEPSIALYCPIEGGGYVIDETVRELARRTGADVLVLDAVQLAAGEWGMFGTSATAIQLPNNPLHFASASPVPGRPSNTREEEQEEEEEEDDDDPAQAIQSSILHFLTPSAPSAPSRPGRSFFSSSRSSASSSSARTKAFFDELLALPPLGSLSQDDVTATNTPRIVYIRDTPTLAASSSAWYPHLLAALRTRRQGSSSSKSSSSPTPSTASTISNPAVLVLGMTPPLTGGQSASPSVFSSTTAPLSAPSASDASDAMPSFSDFIRDLHDSSSPNRGSSRSTGESSSTSSTGTTDPPKRGGDKWGEDEYADKQRALRLRERLRRWEKGMPPPLSVLDSGNGNGSEGEVTPFSPFGGGGPGRGGVVVLGGGPIALGGGMRMQMRLAGGDGSSGGVNGNGEGSSSGYWRHATLVPSERDPEKEREERVARRREINALTIRMAVGALGGVLPTSGECADESREVAERMWGDWGRRVEAWATVRKVADGALGRALERASRGDVEVSGENGAMPVGWEDVFAAWAELGSGLEARKAWMKGEASMLGAGSPDKGAKGEHGEEESSALGSETDELVEKLKRDPDLDQHEQRLLGCIVDSATMPTSFAQVHLPAHTIDSVRTVVSLPLLYPEAFQTGILKEHGMSGVLLFGPPGTGKTLLARALAKEAGCRMMSIAPSDVMDMYVGEGEKLVRAVFALARKLSPCVLFVDELDALFGARASGRDGGSGGGGGAAAHRGVLTEFMQEMDGLRTPLSGGGGKGNERVIVVGATNRPFDLDDAVLRRLPRRLLIDLPGKEEREAILKILLRDEQLGEDVDLRDIASQTESFSGSDLKHLCVSAALDAVKEQVTVPWAVSASPPSPTLTHTGTTGTAAEHSVLPVSTTVATPTTQVLKMLTSDSGFAATKQTSDSHMDVSSTKEPSYTSEKVVDSDTVVEVLSSSSKEDLVSSRTTPLIEPTSESKEEQPKTKSSPSRRVLHTHNFTKALREITPSASESLGTLADLRKWNDEFGEGRRDKKRVQVWGKGTFGFTIPGAPAEGKKGDDKLPPLKDDSGVD